MATFCRSSYSVDAESRGFNEKIALLTLNFGRTSKLMRRLML